MRAWIVGAFALCSACTTPMLTSTDLTQANKGGALATYGVGVTEVELAMRPYGGAEALPEACAAALTAYDTARSTHQDKTAPYMQAIERLADGLEPLLPEEGERARALTTLEKRSFLTQAKALLSLAGEVSSAEASANQAERRVKERCPEEPVRLDATSRVRASHRLLFGLNLQGGGMSNDTVKLVTGADGLPASLTASADDQSAAAVESVAHLIGRLIAPGLGGQPPVTPENALIGEGLTRGGVETRFGPPAAANACRLSALPPAGRIAEMEKRLACLDVPSLVALLEDVLIEPETYADLRPPRPVPPVRYSVGDLEGKNIDYAGLTITVTCAPARSFTGLQASAASRRERIPEVVGGVVVATPVPCELTASAPSQTPQRFSFIGLSEDYLTVVPVDRANLVNNTTTLSFQNGMVSTVDVSRPSVGAAALSLPGRAITSVVSGVTQAFKDSEAIEKARVSQMQAETSRIEAEADRISQPEPAWSAADTAYVSAMATVDERRVAYDLAVAAEDPDPTAIATAGSALRNAKAAANGAAAAAGRPLPFPELL